jgi:hypothetical protein
MIELATVKHHHSLFYALAAAAGLDLGLALIVFSRFLIPHLQDADDRPREIEPQAEPAG